MAITWRYHPWQEHGNSMAIITWQQHGNIIPVIITLQYHGNNMAITCHRPVSVRSLGGPPHLTTQSLCGALRDPKSHHTVSVRSLFVRSLGSSLILPPNLCAEPRVFSNLNTPSLCGCAGSLCAGSLCAEPRRNNIYVNLT